MCHPESERFCQKTISNNCREPIDLESGHVSRSAHARVVCRDDLRHDSIVLACCSSSCEVLACVHSPLGVIIPSWFIMMAYIYLVIWPWREADLYRAPLAWLASVFLFGAALLSICACCSFGRKGQNWKVVLVTNTVLIDVLCQRPSCLTSSV